MKQKPNLITIYFLIWFCILCAIFGWVGRSLLIPDFISDVEWLTRRLQDCQYQLQAKPINFYDFHKAQKFASITYPGVSVLLYKIVDCESGWRSDVCSYAGCDAGAGLAQIIPSTLSYCEEKLERELDVFNSEDNLACAEWLLENEGVIHWKSSRHCWNN